MQDSVVFGSLWSQSSVHALFAEIPRTRAWLEIVAVLAEVQSEFDLIPADSAHAIAACCRSLTVDAALLEEFRAIEGTEGGRNTPKSQGFFDKLKGVWSELTE